MYTAEQIKDYVNKNAGLKLGKIESDDLSFKEQGIDSLDASAILFSVEELTGISIPDEDVDGLQSINKIVVYVNERV